MDTSSTDEQGLSATTHLHTTHSAKNFEAWCSAKTGHPFIDAGMREPHRNVLPVQPHAPKLGQLFDQRFQAAIGKSALLGLKRT